MYLLKILFIVYVFFQLTGCSNNSKKGGEIAYEKGIEFCGEKDYPQAFKSFDKAAKLGNINAKFCLAVLYEKGQGIQKDFPKAIQLYTEAANSDHINAQYNLGNIYLKKNTLKEAEKWYKKAAKNGKVEAQYNLGLLYSRDNKLKEAIKWYKEAAKNNYTDAQFNLGLCFYRGEGTKRDFVQAAHWLNKAAKKEDIEAQLLMGNLYQSGKGVKKDFLQAEEFYLLASRDGNIKAKNALAYIWATQRVKLDEAKKLSKETLKEESDNPSFLDTYGWILFKQENYDESLKQLKRASELAPENCEILNHLGDTYLALKKTEEAKEQWQKALELTKDDDLKKKLQVKLQSKQD